MKKSLVLAFAALLMLTAAVPDKTTTIFNNHLYHW